MKTLETTKIITLDATGQAPGRLASEAAKILRGKTVPQFERYVGPTVEVKIINASKLKLVAAKADRKLYVTYSGYPGGQKLATQAEVTDKFGAKEVLRRAIHGMLPTNKLRARFMKHLTITD